MTTGEAMQRLHDEVTGAPVGALFATQRCSGAEALYRSTGDARRISAVAFSALALAWLREMGVASREIFRDADMSVRRIEVGAPLLDFIEWRFG